MSDKQPSDDMVRCPSCLGFGPCGYCDGVGGVTEDRFHAFHDDESSAGGATALRRRATVTVFVPDGYADAAEFLRDCQFERPIDPLIYPGTRTEIAVGLWRKFANASHIEWENETRKAEYLAAVDDITTGQLFNLLLTRIDFDGKDPRTFSLAELERAIEGAAILRPKVERYSTPYLSLKALVNIAFAAHAEKYGDNDTLHEIWGDVLKLITKYPTSEPLDAEDRRILRMSRPELEAELAKDGVTFDETVARVDAVIERAKEDAAAHLTAEKALRSILMECDEAPTEHNAWVVEIQRIARAALK
jgi:hypothetical protein